MRSSVLVTILSLLVPFGQSAKKKGDDDEHFKTDENYKGVHFYTNRQVEAFLNEFSSYEMNDEPPDEPDSYKGPRPIEVGTPEYGYHVQALKSVKGYIPRNLYIRAMRDNNPYVYISNPIEARFPHPFVPKEDMKDIMWNRIKLQKDVVAESNRDKFSYIRIKPSHGNVYRRSNVNKTTTKRKKITETTSRPKVIRNSLGMRKKMNAALALMAIEKVKEGPVMFPE